MDILLSKKKITKDELEHGKNLLFEIVSMLIGLTKSTSNRVYEDQPDYDISNKKLIRE